MAHRHNHRRGTTYQNTLWSSQFFAEVDARNQQDRMKRRQIEADAQLVLWLYLCSVYDALRPSEATPTNDNGQPVKLVAPHYTRPNSKR